MLLPAGNDPPNVKPGGDVEKVLKRKFGDSIVVREFPGEKYKKTNKPKNWKKNKIIIIIT